MGSVIPLSAGRGVDRALCERPLAASRFGRSTLFEVCSACRPAAPLAPLAALAALAPRACGVRFLQVSSCPSRCPRRASRRHCRPARPVRRGWRRGGTSCARSRGARRLAGRRPRCWGPPRGPQGSLTRQSSRARRCGRRLGGARRTRRRHSPRAQRRRGSCRAPASGARPSRPAIASWLLRLARRARGSGGRRGIRQGEVMERHCCGVSVGREDVQLEVVGDDKGRALRACGASPS